MEQSRHRQASSSAAKDIRGRRFEQASLPPDLTHAIAGQPRLHKLGLTLLVGALCLFASLLLSLLMTTAVLEISSGIAKLSRGVAISPSSSGETWVESLLMSLVVIAWLVSAIYQNLGMSFIVFGIGLTLSIALHGLFIQVGLVAAPPGPFYISTAITLLVCWTISVLSFCLIRFAIAAVQILFKHSRWLLSIGLSLMVLCLLLGAHIALQPDPTLQAAAPSLRLRTVARLISLSFGLALILGGWWSNCRHRIPWTFPTVWRSWALAFGSLGGTSFHNLDLSQVNLAGAELGNTDLRVRSLYRTCFQGATRLERANTDNRYLDLDHPQVQFLLSQGKALDSDFSGLNLQGAYLRGAQLQGIDFTEANLSGADLCEADLTGAILVKTQLIEADLTGAQLTDACIQDWNINSRTSLRSVRCQRVYLKRSPQGHFLEPQPSSGSFAPGEFERWMTELQKNISLLFQTPVNPDALAFALTQTALSYHNPQLLSVQNIQHQSNGGAVAAIEVAPDVDKAEVHQTLNQHYQEAVKTLEAGYQLTLQAKEAEIDRVSQLFKEFYASQNQFMQGLVDRMGNQSEQVVIQGEGNRVYLIEKAGDIMENKDQSIRIGGSVSGDVAGGNVGGKVNIAGDVVGSSVSVIEQLSGQVTQTIQQLRAAETRDSDQLAELLTTLQGAITHDAALSEDQKKEALEAVETIAEEGKKPPEQRITKLCSMAVNALKGLTSTVSEVSTLAGALKTCLPALASLLVL
ncbi:MAG: pentapeptide repeat-containing protein [Leptolyngbya sp. SIO4C1]|nr:pentapeptide repeat-containing protein [Leptolyngbya sp. SIO4C1]